ncbi:MAG: hypothetical protein KKB21_05245 [Nanoarchaeota archaeon]|nr:hypothetical protein [Nanoarchaeota archaeon]MBU4086952.1 hypothetical protein [Nanoarchaeota archaeon]
METFIIIGILGFIIVFILFIFVAIWALRKYYGVNDNSLKNVQTAIKSKTNLLPLTFYLKSRGWGLSCLRIPFGLRTGGPQLTAKVELTDDKIILTWIKREELSYSQLKLVDVYNFGIARNIIFHVKGRISTRYGNIVKKELLAEVLKILQSKGVKLSRRAEKILNS